ncbi:MAG: tRNA (adenine(22)-N(1))-methyltransferase TrmK [Candidatus Dormibacteria bacterium]
MSLPLRLQHVLAAIPHHGDIADIGAGDGQLALSRVRQVMSRVIATEIGGSYPRLLQAIARAPDCAGMIEVRKGHSLEPIHIEEVATIVIAGMGGNTIARMLGDALARKPQWVVLQPMQHADMVEASISAQQCDIDAYDVFMDRGRSYCVWRLSGR